MRDSQSFLISRVRANNRVGKLLPSSSLPFVWSFLSLQSFDRYVCHCSQSRAVLPVGMTEPPTRAQRPSYENVALISAELWFQRRSRKRLILCPYQITYLRGNGTKHNCKEGGESSSGAEGREIEPEDEELKGTFPHTAIPPPCWPSRPRSNSSAPLKGDKGDSHPASGSPASHDRARCRS